MKYIKTKVLAGLVLLLIVSSTMLFSQSYKIRIIQKDTFFYIRPSEDSLKILQLPLGSVLYVEEIEGEWIKAKLPKDKFGIEQVGYIKLSSVEFQKDDKGNINVDKKVDTTQINQSQNPSISKIDIPIELVKAKANRSLGTTLAICGAVVFVPCIVLTFADKVWSWDSWSYKARTPYLIGDAIGLGAGIIGLAVLISANGAIDRIKDEIDKSNRLALNLIFDNKIIGIRFYASF